MAQNNESIQFSAESSRNPNGLPVMKRRIGSVVIISADGKILMGRKEPQAGGVYVESWHIPGGGLESDETEEDAARREAREESGVDLSGIDLRQLPVGHGATVKTVDGQEYWCEMEFNRFEARLDRPADQIELLPPEERSDLVELRWFDPEEIGTVRQIPGGREFFIEMGYIPST